MVTGSIVLFHNKKEDLLKVIESFLDSKELTTLILVDNSYTNELSDISNRDNIIYIKNQNNLGFGKAHNLALIEAYKLNSAFHIFLNPDIYFNSEIIMTLKRKMDLDKSIGLLSPRIEYPNGQTQFLCKLLPTPFDLIIRRFIPFKKIQDRIKERYELRFFDYQKEFDLPSASGCFMFVRTSVLKEIGGFDERFFMYLEDVDISRRIAEISKVLYFPAVTVVHKYAKASYTDRKLLFYHIKSAIQYFNKWGWIFDLKRKKINRTTLSNLNY